MKVIMILFDEEKKNLLCGGIDSDRFIEVGSDFSRVDYAEVEQLMKKVGLSAVHVDYKLLGYSASVWVTNPNISIASVVSEYVVTGTAYDISSIQDGYKFIPVSDFYEGAKSREDFLRLSYLQKALERMNIE